MNSPYYAEYSRSNRSTCRICQNKIEKDILRISVIVKSRKHDGNIPNWHHLECFFSKHTLQSIDEIENYQNLSYDDQEKIKYYIGNSSIVQESEFENIVVRAFNEKNPAPVTTKNTEFDTENICTSPKQTFNVKNGNVVDPISGLNKIAHVYKNGDDIYSAVLTKTDIQDGKNSFYKIQLLEADKEKKFWFFCSWGRIDTNRGGKCIENCTSLEDATCFFENKFEEKTGNQWKDRKNFVKKPKLYNYIDINYEEDASKLIANKSKLDKPIQNLIQIIFDKDLMKNMMFEFKLDMKQMPLGKLSKTHIQSAFNILNDLQKLVDEKAKDDDDFIDPSNRFYTSIPHSFGDENPPILNTSDIIKQKWEMLENLRDIEIAYRIMNDDGKDFDIDASYEKLETDLKVLDKGSEEFKIIQEYVTNTKYCVTCRPYELEIVEVFVVKRHNEDIRYKPFKEWSNKKLLWHGSRLTNYAGILTQGLRIAPPEAPVTGYRFGKGIYFADMVSLSATFCEASSENPTGLLLLCEVALGEMHECKTNDNNLNLKRLPKGKHSCKCIGKIEPNPIDSKQLNGVEVPCGKIIKKENLKYDCNEYIVYDVAQVNIKYLLQMNFKFKINQ